jgi:YggT family protein
MNIVIFLLIKALDIYLWLIIASVVVSWLVAFDVLNTRNKWVYKFCSLLNRLTNPGMARLRRIIPPLGGIDLTPMVMLFGIYLVQGFLLGLLR